MTSANQTTLYSLAVRELSASEEQISQFRHAICTWELELVYLSRRQVITLRIMLVMLRLFRWILTKLNWIKTR